LIEMARGRRRDQWEHTAALIHWIAGTFAGQRVDMEALNPVPRLDADPPPDPAAEKAEAAEGWANLRAAFQAWGNRHYGGGIG